MKKIFLVLLLQIFCLSAVESCHAQVKNSVAKLNAFVRETVAGNVPVDEHGNQTKSGVDHLHYLYAETTGKFLPQWDMVYTNSGVFAIQAEEIDSIKVTVGKLKNSSKAAAITRKKGNRLWKLTLVPVKARTPDNIAALLKKNEVVVITEFGGKQFTHTIAKEIELEPVFYP